MRISDVSIRNPVMSWMIMAALIVFGAISFSRLGISQLPDVDFPVLTVSVAMEGASPEAMETSVVDILEDSLMTVQGVRSISSNSKMGSASVTIEFELEKNIDIALQDVQAKVLQAQKRLPKEIDTPTISKTNPDDQPIMWLALTSEKNDLEFIMRFAREYLKDRFTTVAGVGDIFLGGYTDPQLRVWVKPQALERNNVSVNDILDAINTEHTELPGGVLETQTKNFNVRTLGEAKSVAEFNNIILSRRAGQTIQDSTQLLRMKDVAEVREGLDEIRRISRFNGKTALGLGIRKQRGTNAVAVAKAVREKLEEIKPQLPPGVNVEVNFDSTQFIEQSIKELNKHLVLAVILTSIVCWVFLGSWTATVNVLLSIPTSIIGTFIALYFMGFTLNTFTLLGLTLAIGIVVDDAIMILENIFRFNELGKGRIESAIVGSREITFAAIAATVAVIAIFLPVAFMKGVIGKFFMQFGVTISFAVFLSLIEALTITPMRCASFVHSAERKTRIGIFFDSFMEWLEKTYHKTLVWSLNHKLVMVLGTVIFLVVSFWSLKFINKELTPLQDQSIFLARLQTPVGSSFAFTDGKTKLAEEWFRKQPEVLRVYASIGGFSTGVADSNVAMMFVTMIPKDQRKVSQQDFMNRARKELKSIQDLTVRMQDLSARGFSSGRGFPIEFTVLGPNWDKLAGQAQKIMAEMKASGIMTDIDSNYLEGMPEISIVPDRTAAAHHGVSVAAIGKTINALMGGVINGQYERDGKRYDIRVKIEPSQDPLSQLKYLKVANTRGNMIPLSQVVTQVDRESLQSISRMNRQRAISVYANLLPGKSQQEAMDYITKRSTELLEPGYFLDKEGSSKSFKESFQSLIFALILGLVVAYMILAAQFNSFIDPVTILMALPFSIGGALAGLMLTGQSINMYSMIGVLLLMGIVKKNSIMLVEFANQVRERDDLDARTSLLKACPVRLRPILMTSFSTIAGAIPSALAQGAGAETFRPMAITIIGGTLFSTFLTLVVVPAVYLGTDRLRKRDQTLKELKTAFRSVGTEGILE